MAVADIDATRPPTTVAADRRRRGRGSAAAFDGRRDRPRRDVALAVRRGRRPSAGSTSCSTTPGIAGVGTVHETSRRAVGPGHGRQRPRRVPRRPGGRAAHDRGRSRVDHQHVVDDRRDRPGQPGVVRRLQGRRPGADPPDAGRLRDARDPGQRAAARDDPHAVRRSLPARRATTTRSPVSRRSSAAS